MNMIRFLSAAALLLLAVQAHAALNVLATVPEWAALAQEIGGAQVKVSSATTALQDPHRIDAKPSLIARARNADLVIATGADLEVGWLPLVLRESGNARVQPGRPGYFEAAQYVAMLEIPARIDRSAGDVHAAGNPHIQLDPRNILKVGEALAARMAELDPTNASEYAAGFRRFAERWRAAIARWEEQAAPLRDVPVVVQHKAFPYLIAWLGMREVATLEPRPGVEPTSGQLAEVAQRLKATPAKMVIRPAYQGDAASRWISERSGIPAVVLPFTVGGSPEAKDLQGLFDDTLKRLSEALK
jgi:zinc/manganese transport system substrate-binding protein